MAVELSHVKGSIQEAARELGINPGRIPIGGNDIKKTINSSLLMLRFLTSSNRLEGCKGSLEKLRWNVIF